MKYFCYHKISDKYLTEIQLSHCYHMINQAISMQPLTVKNVLTFRQHLSYDCLDNSFIHLYDLLPLCFGPCPVWTDIECAALPVPRCDWNLPLLSVVSLNVGLSWTWHSNPNIQKQGPAELKLWEDIPKKLKVGYY